MTTLRTTAQQALEALQNCANGEDDVLLTRDALAALRAALEQPEQGPVAWCDIEEDGTIHGLRYWSEPGRREHALYTHPPRREWQELSNGEIYTAYITATNQTLRPQDERLALAFARAIEAALKEKNHE